MKKISSGYTFFWKRIYPTIFLGGILFIIVYGVLSDPNIVDKIPVYIVLSVMFILGIFFCKFFVFDLIDEVYDEGDSLLFINRGKKVSVALKDIKNLSYQQLQKPQRITVSVRYETELGSKLSFSPIGCFSVFSLKNKTVQELIDRIDEARRKKKKKK